MKYPDHSGRKGDMIEVYEVVKKLIGEINPIGETQTDEQRYKNLEATCDLVDKLLTDIYWVTTYKDSREYSVKKAGELAYKFHKGLVKD